MKISIITVTYNSGRTLLDTFESILAQSYTDFEEIVVDGGSTDGTLQILREYEPRFNGRLHWISEPDRGIYDAMNKGIRLSTGDVVGFLNSDDFYASAGILQSVAEALADESIDAVYGDVSYVKPFDLNRVIRYFGSKKFRPWKMRLGFMPPHPSFYCRSGIYSKYGGFDLDFKIAADFEQLLRFIFVNGIRTKYIEKNFVTMRDGGASSSGFKSHFQSYRERRLAFRKNNVYSNFIFATLLYLSKLTEYRRR